MSVTIKQLSSILAICALAGCASNPRDVEPRNQVHEASDGTEIIIDEYYFVSEDCQPNRFTIQVTSPARHGTLIVRPGTRTISGRLSPLGPASKKCDGREVDTRQLVYQSKLGYTGQDKFEIFVRDLQNEDQQRFVPYRINVKPR
jgi:hypothetical protein